MRAGLYALASLDGAPLDRQSLELLGMTDEHPDRSRYAPGLVVRIWDDMPGYSATSFATSRTGLIAFNGFLDEPEALRERLGLAEQNAAALAWSAVERWGDAAPEALIGDWTLLHWDAAARRLTLLLSEPTRDTLYWASDGRVLAVAPESLRLAELPWVGRAFDPRGMALTLSRQRLRRILTRETVWKGISRMLPAVREEFSAQGRCTILPAPDTSPTLWKGSFEDAVEASEAILRRILSQQLQRYGHCAFLLSGGIDSSLLTVLAAECSRDGEMFCLSSIAPEGSGLKDEREFSFEVAKQAGVPLHYVCPSPDVSVYRPAVALWERFQAPRAGTRHYLYEALFAAAIAGGARAVVDGVGGEFSVTRKPRQVANLAWWRRMRVVASLWRQKRRMLQGWPVAAFHARLSPDFMHSLPIAWKEVWKQDMDRLQPRAPGEPAGVDPNSRKSSSMDTLVAPGLRRILPFFNRRLLEMAATFPTEFFEHQGVTRALARAMLRDRVPENVRLRLRGMPISPDYMQRLQSQAADARARLPVFYAAGADRYLDLAWLEQALGRAEGNTLHGGAATECQLTACAAEFFVWAAERQG